MRAMGQELNLPASLKNVSVKGVRQMVLCALWIVCVFLLAKMTWQIYEFVFMSEVHPSDLKETSEKTKRPTQASSPIDIANRLNKMDLFGEVISALAPARPESPKSVPKTALALTLTGLLTSNNPDNSMAIIQYQNKQKSYFVGDVITGQAKIIQIDAEGVIIDEAGKHTRLAYLDTYQSKPSNVPNTQTVETRSGNAGITTALKDELLSAPEKLFDYITVSPVKDNDALIGYRINPGKEAQMFTELGFMPGDLAIEINGVDLTDEIQSLALLSELPEMTELSINVQREGQIYTINLSLNP